jgi:hypothetical protein
MEGFSIAAERGMTGLGLNVVLRTMGEQYIKVPYISSCTHYTSNPTLKAFGKTCVFHTPKN